MPKLLRLALALVVLCLTVWIVLSWPAMQDDAFIHLRYAENLLRHHFVTYDGVRPSFGASSLLYITLLAGLRAVWSSPLLPRAVSTAAHVLLFAGLLAGFARGLRRAPRIAWVLALLTLLSLSTPAAVRWLDDGMETSLVLCFMTLFAFGAVYLERERAHNTAVAAALGLLAVLAVLLRVELLMFTVLYSLLLIAGRRDAMRHAAVRKVSPAPVVLGFAPLAGGVIGAGLIVVVMHVLMPDTALAKATGHLTFRVFRSAAQAVASSTTLGLGLFLAYVLSLVAVLASRRRSWMAVLLANCFFPVTVVLAALRGQDMAGVRYLVWTLFFPAVWNVLALRGEGEEAPEHTNLFRLAVASVLLVALGSVAEAPLLMREFSIRRTELAQFRSEHLEQIHELPVVAYDIGYIGYFTQSPICDLAGLVNGRDFARLGSPQRYHACIAARPRVAFVTGFTLYDMSATVPDYAAWKVCNTYNFATLRDPRPHYLIAGPEVAERVCSAAGGTPQPVTNIMPVALESQRHLILPQS